MKIRITLTITVNDTIVLNIIAEKHAEPMLNLVNANRLHLKEWLSWVDNMQTVAHFNSFIADAKRRYLEQTDMACVILVDGSVAGRIGVYHIDHRNKTASIGYWIGTGFKGKGIVTKACSKLVAHCFDTLHLNRIEIRCGTKNYKSQAIPERLRFTKEGVMRQGEFVNNAFIDLYVYSMLKAEWKMEHHGNVFA